MIHFEDNKAELNLAVKEKDIALMSAQAWKNMGARPFDDPTDAANATPKVDATATAEEKRTT